MSDVGGQTADPADWFKNLDVKGDFSAATLDAYFKAVQASLAGDMTYLRRPIDRWRGYSNWTRNLGFIAVAAGVLLPVPIWDTPPEWPTGIEMGYLAVLIGGLVLLLDRLFNVSGSWMRLTLTEMQVKQVRYRLDLDWAKRRPLLAADNGATEGPALIDILRGALDAAHQIMETQKKTWTGELTQAMETLQARLDVDRTTLAQMHLEERRSEARPTTGGVTIKIDKPQELVAPLRIRIGSLPEKSLDFVPASWPLIEVPPGLTTVAIEAGRAAPAGGRFVAALPVTAVVGQMTEASFAI